MNPHDKSDTPDIIGKRFSASLQCNITVAVMDRWEESIALAIAFISKDGEDFGHIEMEMLERDVEYLIINDTFFSTMEDMYLETQHTNKNILMESGEACLH